MDHHHLTTPHGRELGLHLARLTNPTIFRLSLEGEPDTRCKSCAFTLGTVPNGSPQATMDALKCVMEGVPFYCHVKRRPSGEQELCHGWYAGRVALGWQTHQMPWPFATDEPDAGAGEGEGGGMSETFVEELQGLLTKYSLENGSDTPDFLLAEYLLGCLDLFDTVIQGRERWYGRGKTSLQGLGPRDEPPAATPAAGEGACSA